MFFMIAQKINNVFLQTNDIFTFKIGIIGFIFYLIIFLFIKLPILNKINKNNWLLFGLFMGLSGIDTILICYEYIIKIKILDDLLIKQNIKLINLTEPNNQINDDDYETITELATTEE